MKVNGYRVKKKGRENSNFKMEIYMKVDFKLIINKDREKLYFKVDQFLKDIGIKIKLLEMVY